MVVVNQVRINRKYKRYKVVSYKIYPLKLGVTSYELRKKTRVLRKKNRITT